MVGESGVPWVEGVSEISVVTSEYNFFQPKFSTFCIFFLFLLLRPLPALVPKCNLGRAPRPIARPPAFQQIEDLLAERILIATVPERNEGRWQVAKLLLTVVVQGLVECDRTELERVASSPEYRIGLELRRLLDEIEQEEQTGTSQNEN